jgi:hypothetical protein
MAAVTELVGPRRGAFGLLLDGTVFSRGCPGCPLGAALGLGTGGERLGSGFVLKGGWN